MFWKTNKEIKEIRDNVALIEMNLRDEKAGNKSGRYFSGVLSLRHLANMVSKFELYQREIRSVPTAFWVRHEDSLVYNQFADNEALAVADAAQGFLEERAEAEKANAEFREQIYRKHTPEAE